MNVALKEGENSILIDDKPIRISGIQHGNIKEIFIHNSEDIPIIAFETGLGTINLIEGKFRVDGRLGPEHGLLFFTMTIGGKVHYLTPKDWKVLETEGLPSGWEFPKDAVCVPVYPRGFPSM